MSISWCSSQFTISMVKNLPSTPGQYIVESVNSFYISYQSPKSDLGIPLVSSPSQTPGTYRFLFTSFTFY
jgi:hypothetical protein